MTAYLFSTVLRSASTLQKILSQTAFYAYVDDISVQRASRAKLRADLSLSGEAHSFEELLFKVTHKNPQMYLKLTSTLRQQTPLQDPFLSWKQSRPLDVSLERYSDNASPEVPVSPLNLSLELSPTQPQSNRVWSNIRNWNST